MEALHGFVHAMLCAASHHDISVAQLLLIGQQELSDYSHYGQFDPYPRECQGLKKLG